MLARSKQVVELGNKLAPEQHISMHDGHAAWQVVRHHHKMVQAQGSKLALELGSMAQG